jgi:hypothetical protein
MSAHAAASSYPESSRFGSRYLGSGPPASSFTNALDISVNSCLRPSPGNGKRPPALARSSRAPYL